MERIRDKFLKRRDRSGSVDTERPQSTGEPEKQPIEENNQAEPVEENSAQKNGDVKQAPEEKLFEAAKRGDRKEVDELLNQGVPVDCSDDVERTPLMEGAYRGHAEVINHLIDHGADVNAVDVAGETAIFRATYGDHLELVKLLHGYGADLAIRNMGGRTAWDIAKDGGATDIASYIEEQLSGGQEGQKNEIPTDPDDDDPDPHPARALASGAMLQSPVRKPYVTTGDRDNSSAASAAAAPAAAFRHYLTPEDLAVAKEIEASLAPKAEILEAMDERIEFDALDNKQVRNINQKVIKVLDKAGFEVGDFVINTVFKGSHMAVLKPRSQENKRWRKLRKHPDWVIDPKRLTELAGACAVRRYCQAAEIEVSSFTISHFIELYYVKDLKLLLTLADEASANDYTVRQLKLAADDLREHKDDLDPGKEIIKTLDQPVPIMEDPDLMALCTDKNRVLQELSKAERKKIRALIKERKPGLDEWKRLMETFEVILSDLKDE